MKAVAIRVCVMGVLCGVIFGVSATAQRSAVNARAAAGTYNPANEVSVQGTVVKYAENSSAPPIGTHVLVQTSSGNVDVHLGDARLLHLVNFKITPGATVRFIGQSQQIGSSSIFLARLVQMGSQMLAVRSEQGFLYGPKGIHAPANKALVENAAAQKGVAR